jgi:hypothetical protein
MRESQRIVASLSMRARNCLKNASAGLTDDSTARQVARVWPQLVVGALRSGDVHGSIKNMGRGTLAEVAEWLRRNRIKVDLAAPRPRHYCPSQPSGPWRYCPYCGQSVEAKPEAI